MLAIEPGMANKFWARSPMAVEHMSFWYLFWHLHLTTHYSNIGAWFKIRNQIRLVYRFHVNGICQLHTQATLRIGSAGLFLC